MARCVCLFVCKYFLRCREPNWLFSNGVDLQSARVSLIPFKNVNGIILDPTPISLSSCTGQSITCYGQAKVQIKIPSLRRAFEWIFIIADVVHPLIGFDFLENYGLLVDCKERQIIDRLTDRKVQVAVSMANDYVGLIVNEVQLLPEIDTLLKKYPYITSPQDNKDAIYCGVYHRIETGSNPPVFAKTRQLSETKLKIAQEGFRALQSSGVITPSESEWRSPLQLVPKNNGEYRPCGDYRALNTITKVDRYPIPNINSFSSKLVNKKYFSKIDLTSAYHQIKVHPDDVSKTAITTPFGLFEYKYMPFGLRNAASTFQRAMDKIFSTLLSVFIYLDEILVFSDDLESHLRDLEKVFEILNRYNLKISLHKCVFCVKELDFLGFNVSTAGLKPTENKISELKEFPYPTDSKALRRYLGMVGFYRKLVPNFASIVLPLTECIRTKPNHKTLELTDDEKKAFDKIKEVLSELKAIAHIQTGSTQFQLVTDSSQYAVGAALHQMVNEEAIPVGFFSKKLSQAQTKYSAFDRELLAAYLAVLHFKPLIEGHFVLLLTDHKPLCSAFKSTSPAKSDRQQRHLSLLTEYIADISHIKGSQNIVADCLSRPANAVTLDVCDLPEIANTQVSDEEIKLYEERLKPFRLISDDKQILCDTSTPYPRPFVPESLRKAIFDSLHSLSHPGISSTQKLVKARYFWPGMDRSIKQWCRECMPCQQSKVNRHTKSAVSNFDLPSSRFQTVHIDIVGPLPTVQNPTDPYISPYRYLLTCIDRATRWIEVQPLADITAKTVTRAFIDVWISRFGVPLHVITDRGSQFESEMFDELSSVVGFHRLRTTAYHPQTNGMIERIHRTVKTTLKARKGNWLTALPIILLGIRNTLNENGISPFNAVTGTSLLIPKLMVEDNSTNTNEFNTVEMKELAKEMAKLELRNLDKGKCHSLPKTFIPKDLKSCDKVWLRTDRVRKPLEAPYSGPYKVIERYPKYFKIQLANDVYNNVSIDRLKPVIEPTNNLVPSSNPVNEDDVNSNEETDVNNEDSEAITVPKSSSGRRIRFKKDNDYFYF